jgi:hypothetical protein
MKDMLNWTNMRNYQKKKNGISGRNSLQNASSATPAAVSALSVFVIDVLLTKTSLNG